jgi:DNA-binding LacI/PurR family transcriptional regulator/DNA-binding transcriptional regulator YhcF (GntR family)
MAVSELNLADLNVVQIDLSSDAPLYAQVSTALRVLIQERFQPGDAFFTEKALVQHLPVSGITIRRALDDLRREGLLVRKRGLGTVVSLGRKAERQEPAVAFSSPPLGGKRAAILQKTVGVFRGDCYSEYMNAMIEQFSAVCAERDINVQVYHTRNGERVAQAFQQVTRTPEQEGIILFTSANVTDLLYHALDGQGYRTVAVDGASADYPGSFVRTDAVAAVEIAMDELLRLGHRRIVFFVNEPAGEPTVVEKIAAFHEILRAKDLEGIARLILCNTRPCVGAYEAAYVHMADVWHGDAEAKPTAVFTASDPGAWACLKWFAERGVSVPGDVSVLGFEDARSSRVMHPALSSVAHPLQAIARRVVDLLWNKEEQSPRHELIRPFLVTRESTGPVRADN